MSMNNNRGKGCVRSHNLGKPWDLFRRWPNRRQWGWGYPNHLASWAVCKRRCDKKKCA